MALALSPHREIPALTGLRGVAASYVVAFHLMPVTPTNPLLRHFVQHGYLAVDVFFVLSGFVMALTYARYFTAGFTWGAYGKFLVRRLARIWPLYIALLAVFVILEAVGLGRLVDVPHAASSPASYESGRLAVNVLMLQAWGFGETMIVPSWSVSTELAAYLAFPVLLGLTVSGGRASAVLSGSTAVLLIVYCATIGVTHETNPHGALDLSAGVNVYPLLRCVGGFVFGLLIFRIAALPSLARIGSSDLFGFSVLAFLLCALATPVFDLWIYPLFPALVLSLTLNRGRVARLFSGRLIYGLGMISYALYLVHDMVYHAARPWVDGLGNGLSPRLHHAYVALSYSGMVALVTVLAFLLNRFVEVPARSWIRGLSSRHAAVRVKLGARS